MTRDTFDAFDRFSPRDRGRFGDNEHRSDQPERLKGGSKLTDLTLQLRQEKPLAIAVTDPAKPGASPWIWLPKSQIEFTTPKAGVTTVTVPEWLAKEKGLI